MLLKLERINITGHGWILSELRSSIEMILELYRYRVGTRFMITKSPSFLKNTLVRSISRRSIGSLLWTQSSSTFQSLTYSMQIYETLISLVLTLNYFLQWPLKGIQKDRIIVIITYAVTRTALIRLIYDDLMLFLNKNFLMSC